MTGTKLPIGWSKPAGAADEVVDIAMGAKNVADDVVEGGVKVVKDKWRSIFGGKKTDAGTSVGSPSKGKKVAKKVAKKVGKYATIGATGYGAIKLAKGVMPEGAEDAEDYTFDLGNVAALQNAGYDDSTIRALIEAQYGAGGGGGSGGSGGGGGGGGYGALRKGFRDYAGTLRDYGAGQEAALTREYGDLATRADADAAEAEAVARMAYEDIGRIGQDYAQAATRDITSVGAGGPTETTGLVPVSGELYDIPGRIADTSQVAADYVLRDLNLTRDDLAYMGDVARMMGPAYASQLNNTISMSIANKKFELDQQIAAQQAADARSAASSSSGRRDSYYDKLIALEEMRMKQGSAVNPGSVQIMADEYQRLLDSPRGRQSLAASGINVDNPTVGFQQYVTISQGAAKTSTKK
tara:strand:+ start:1042 stop:2271 length:1230 start_codon:yes stop_codon:yes gene_type:complete